MKSEHSAVYGFDRTLCKEPTLSSHRTAPEHTHPDQVPVHAALAALSDPVRLGIVRELAAAEDWARSCGAFDVPVGKAARSHHFAVLRNAGLIEQRDVGPRRVNRLRREEFEARFPGLLTLVLRNEGEGVGVGEGMGVGLRVGAGEEG
jgi:DNA-binding transcriptional ArsR family regulator